MNRRRIGRSLALFSVLVVPALALAATPFTNPDLGYSFDLPEDWRRVPRATLESLSRAAAERTKVREPEYVAGFSRASGTGLGYPYVLIQHHAIRRSTPERLARAFTGLDRVEAVRRIDSSELVQKTEIGKPVLDTERHAVMMPLSMTVANVGPVRGLTVAFPLAAGVLQMNFYARAPEYENDLSDFTAMLDSLAIETEPTRGPRMTIALVFVVVFTLVILTALAFIMWRRWVVGPTEAQ